MKKTVALILAVLMLMSSLGAFAFTPRLEPPLENHPYYYSNLNIFYKLGYGMPNCTAYAFGRAYEILGEEPKLSSGSAFRWYTYNKEGGYYPYGNEPKVGAIACFGANTANPSGHVAVIEKIEGNYAYLSNSSWKGYLFRVDMRPIDAWDTAYKVGGEYLPFEGFIYLYDECVNHKYSSNADLSCNKCGEIRAVLTENPSVNLTADENGKVVLPEICKDKDVLSLGWVNEDGTLFDKNAVLSPNQEIIIKEKLLFTDKLLNASLTSSLGDETQFETGAKYTNGLYVQGAQIRVPSETVSLGLRFVNVINEDLISALKNVTEIKYGTLVTKQKSTLPITADTKGVFKSYCDNVFLSSQDLVGNYHKYTACIVSIPESDYKANLKIRPFISYVDLNGETRYIYGEEYCASLFDVAQKAVDEGKESDEVLEYFKNNILG